MAKKTKKIKLYVVWGRSFLEKATYSFNSEEEKKAFIKGAEAAQGWDDFATFDNLKDRNEYFKEVNY